MIVTFFIAHLPERSPYVPTSQATRSRPGMSSKSRTSRASNTYPCWIAWLASHRSWMRWRWPRPALLSAAARLPEIMPVSPSMGSNGLRSSRWRAARRRCLTAGSGASSAPCLSSAIVTGDRNTGRSPVSFATSSGVSRPCSTSIQMQVSIKKPTGRKVPDPRYRGERGPGFLHPATGGFRREGVVQILHGLEGGLMRWKGNKPSNFPVVAFDHHLLTLPHDTVEDLSEITGKLRRGYGLHGDASALCVETRRTHTYSPRSPQLAAGTQALTAGPRSRPSHSAIRTDGHRRPARSQVPTVHALVAPPFPRPSSAHSSGSRRHLIRPRLEELEEAVADLVVEGRRHRGPGAGTLPPCRCGARHQAAGRPAEVHPVQAVNGALFNHPGHGESREDAGDAIQVVGTRVRRPSRPGSEAAQAWAPEPPLWRTKAASSDSRHLRCSGRRR